MQGVRSLSRAPVTPVLLGLAITGGCVAFILAVVGSTYPDALEPLLLGMILVAVSLPALMRQARREQNDRLFWLLLAALVVKLIASMVRYRVSFGLYQGVADAAAYHQAGVQISEAFRHGNFATGLSSLVSTNFIRFLTGAVYTVIGPNILGGFLVFSWLGYWGLFLFYRAFTIAVPEGRALSYSRLVFFLPSMLFWPSSIGKEAWMMFALGIAVFGVAKILSGATVRGMAITGAGLWLAAVVRPPLAGILALALAGAYLLRRTRPELRQLAPLAKGFSFVVLVVLAAILVVRTDRFLRAAGIDTAAGPNAVSSALQERTSGGGSAFAPTSIIASPLQAPIGVFSVLFRPLIFDVHSLPAVATALEGTFLLAFSIVRIRWLWAAVKSARRQPYVAFSFLFTVLFVIGFSSVANFGLLARERVQLLPMYLVLFAIPRPEKESEEERTMNESKEERTMDQPRKNWLTDRSPVPRPRRSLRDPDPRDAQPDVASMVEHLQTLEKRTRELEAQIRHSRPDPTAEPEPTQPEGEEISARFTELARRAFSSEFEQLRSEAQRNAEAIVTQARAQAERISLESRNQAEQAQAEADQVLRRARTRSEEIIAASTSRSSQVANELRALLSRIDRTVEDLDTGTEGIDKDEQSHDPVDDLFVIQSLGSGGSDETPDAPASGAARAEETTG